MKPIIGVVSRPSLSLNKYECHIIDEEIKNSIIASGGIPLVILPMQEIYFHSANPKDVPLLTEENKKDIDRILSMCDGIVCPGGTRVYEYDYYICRYAKENNIPILGICAGMQLMARVDSDNYNEEIETNNHQTEDKYAHEVTIKEGTLLYDIVKKDRIKVNSYHNYKVHDSGVNIVSATSDDGVIEAIENPNYKFYLGVQWHPEKLKDLDNKKILNYFIEVTKNKSF